MLIYLPNNWVGGPHEKKSQIVHEKLYRHRPRPLRRDVQVTPVTSRVQSVVQSVQDIGRKDHRGHLQPTRRAHSHCHPRFMLIPIRIRPKNRPDAVECDEKVAILDAGVENVQAEDQQGAVAVGQPPTRVQVADQIGDVQEEDVEDVGGHEVDEVNVEGRAEAGTAQERQEDAAVGDQRADHRNKVKNCGKIPCWSLNRTRCKNDSIICQIEVAVGNVERNIGGHFLP